mgnify:CR=1 FL=1
METYHIVSSIVGACLGIVCGYIYMKYDHRKWLKQMVKEFDMTVEEVDQSFKKRFPN